MKRAGHLMERIASLENLHEAFLRAARGKQGKYAVIDFRNHLSENLLRMRDELLTGRFRFGQYHFFTIYDPKRRTICAASFPERVAFHAMMRICHPVFDQFQISDSYASRIGKGTYAALERAQYYCRRYGWYAKMDIRHYFDTIDHGILLSQLCRLFKDPQLLQYFQTLLSSYEVEMGKGLPIGNLTSQYFANHYLALADHYMKEQVCVPALVRYMDDVLLFAKDKDALKSYVSAYTDYIQTHLRLENHEPIMNRTSRGVPFLGYIVHTDSLRLNLRSKRRFCHKMRTLSDDLSEGRIDESVYATRATALLAFAKKARCQGFLQSVAQIKGMYPQGL